MVDWNDPDVALMLRVKRGDLSAYEELVEKFKQPVMNLVYRLINDLDEAEDIAQKRLRPGLEKPRTLRGGQQVHHLAFHHRPQPRPERDPAAHAPPG